MRYHRTTAAAGERAHVVQGSLILDRYRPLGEAGSGGFGAVQVAWDPRIQRKVAIKIIELTEVDALRAALPGADAVQPAPAAQPVPGSSAPAAFRSGVAAEQPAPAAQQTIAAPQPAPAAQQASEAQRSKTDPVSIDARERWHGVLPWDDVLAEEGDALPEGLPRKTLNWEDDGFEPDGADLGTAVEAEGFEQVRALSRIPGIDEARTAALLSDPRIVTVYDVEVRDCCAYLIMEYVEGVTLTRLLYDYDDLLTLDMVTAVFDAVSKALQVAHARGVLHLDIKPDNILVNREGQVKVTDFGLATLADASGRGTTGGGTIGYMPLEQMRKQELDARCDEWALASVTYEMLAGENPFLAADLQAAEAAIENAELVIPSLCWEDLDEGIDDAIFYALDPDREQRYASVRDFAEEAEAFLGDAQRGTRQLSLLVKDALGDGEAADGKLADELETEGGEQESWLCGSEGRAVERTPRIPLRGRCGGKRPADARGCGEHAACSGGRSARRADCRRSCGSRGSDSPARGSARGVHRLRRRVGCGKRAQFGSGSARGYGRLVVRVRARGKRCGERGPRDARDGFHRARLCGPARRRCGASACESACHQCIRNGLGVGVRVARARLACGLERALDSLVRFGRYPRERT